MTQPENSPFHAAEIAVQKRLGVADQVAQYSGGIRKAMPMQHRKFFCELPFVILGLVDQQGFPWCMPLFPGAAALSGHSGFITSPTDTRLELQALPALTHLLNLDFAPGRKVGMLGIQLHTRRRNRMNGVIGEVAATGFSIDVELSFGNCPKYIQTRELQWVKDESAALSVDSAVVVDGIAEQAKSLITQSDTFFIASRTQLMDSDPRHGVDASHRGGKPGFVKVEGDTLLFPDFSGNRFFNTLGNIESDGRVGLFFPDFSTGNVLLAAGRAEVLWDHPSLNEFEGAQRVIAVTVEKSTYLEKFMPVTGELQELSPALDGTGVWKDRKPSAAATYQSLKLMEKRRESDKVTSFYLAPDSGETIKDYIPGQFLPVEIRLPGHKQPLKRHYTLSSGRAAGRYRITVKREENGEVSKALHDHIQVGDVIHAGAPAGQFTLRQNDHAVVLISAGVGITPMIAMLEGLIHEVNQGAAARPVWFIHATQNSQSHLFADELTQLAAQYDWLHLHTVYSRPLPQDKPHKNHDSEGHISIELLKHILPFDQYDFYLCGSEGFMRSIYKALVSTGVQKANIYYEFFGEGTIGEIDSSANIAGKAQVSFSQSGVSGEWSSDDGSLLAFAEKLSVTAPFSCRSGNCGACMAPIKKGSVAYQTPTSFSAEAGNALLCCAKPAEGSAEVVIDI
ncbi:2Fe-2S iron-sulfur cluster binding domain-containing protein [Hahella sp. KA22]|uniref:FAD-binding oxidoreductase n=1 Tax=Hahella sp. KA22 TaxID=1628392 RepID=UPI000FDDB5F6|nr:pyridoxamine 5'-phosphate oxidase family protein [Hahella sp. KA22]AZZ92461.1 2Fe-2S iron-sulfur cluster binding domain-containing protein [Hahella sp. KA22]QAY55835.1 2Fe-2S iron-sulfur cluster binding domain-containing protein [Hahella sp. KA22]